MLFHGLILAAECLHDVRDIFGEGVQDVVNLVSIAIALWVYKIVFTVL